MTFTTYPGRLVANQAFGLDMSGLQGGSERDTKRSRRREFECWIVGVDNPLIAGQRTPGLEEILRVLLLCNQLQGVNS
jgi:hypothetical protein